MPKPTNVRIVATGLGTRLHFEMGAERFHLWLDPTTLRPKPDVVAGRKMTLYANQIERTSTAAKTRHLDAHAKRWAPLLATILGGLDLTAERARIAEAARQEAKADARARLAGERTARMQARTVRMYELLRRYLAAPTGLQWREDVRAVLHEIDHG